MKTLRRHWDLVLALIMAACLSAVAPLLVIHRWSGDPAATGKVSTFEPGKSIALEASQAFMLDGDTKLEGDIAVGKTVNVWMDGGKTTRVSTKSR